MDFITDLFTKGGLMIYPLLILLIWGVIIIAIKSMSLRRSAVLNPNVVEKVEELLLKRKIPVATAYCKQNSLPMTRVILA